MSQDTAMNDLRTRAHHLAPQARNRVVLVRDVQCEGGRLLLTEMDRARVEILCFVYGIIVRARIDSYKVKGNGPSIALLRDISVPM